ncbi:MAG TPA: IS630 family transposase, partial [Polyangia bacterium]|nr:IS630 family transposase [Polyangia bacterium]
MAIGTMWLAVHDCGWTHKKRPKIARELDRSDVRAKRQAFVELQPHLDPTKLIFIDESGFRLGTPPNYRWAPLGEKSVGHATHGDWCTMTMICAIALDGWPGFVTIDAPTDGDVAYVQQQLAPRLNQGDIVVMDNLNAHKRPDVIAAIRAVGAQVLFLPPYSPEYNPIEKAWAKLKDVLRRLPTLSRDAFDHAVAYAMSLVSNADVRAWTICWLLARFNLKAVQIARARQLTLLCRGGIKASLVRLASLVVVVLISGGAAQGAQSANVGEAKKAQKVKKAA